MSDRTKIEWADATWNPTRGCTRISPGCQHCYAERKAARFCDAGEPFAGYVNRHPAHWTGRVELIESQLEIPLHWKKPRRIFVDSMSDLFHESLPDEAIDKVFAVMALCPQHTFQVLTKRAHRMEEWFRQLTTERIMDGIWAAPTQRGYSGGWPLPNIWLGVSCEDRKRKERIEHLRATPATVRFLSLEPLLEDLGELDLRGIHWVIVGGESGPGARPMHPDWVRGVRDQCVGASVPFFFKQWGGARKEKAGAMLDGREWREFPG